MTFILTFIFFLLGLAIGSFLNVMIFRLNTGRGFRGRSGCMVCQNVLTWKELIPIASFVALRGRCKNCKSKIAWQYPLVEFFTGALFAALFLKFESLFYFDTIAFSLTYAYYATMFSLLTVLSVYDLRHKIIPDSLSIAFAALSFAGMFLLSGFQPFTHLPSVSDFLSGFALSLPFALMWLISKGTWMGLGDAKLVLGLGWFLGMAGILSTAALAFWLGALISLFLIIVRKKYGLKSEIPFAPFLVLGTIFYFLFEVNFFPVIF